MALTGTDALLTALTKTVTETALDEEIPEPLGCDKHEPMGCKHEPVGRNRDNSRNGRRSKTLLSDSSG